MRKFISSAVCVIITALILISSIKDITLLKIPKSQPQETAAQTASYEDDCKLRGTIFDRNGVPLVYTQIMSDTYYYREVNKHYTFSTSPLVSGITSEEGLEDLYEEVLRKNNPTPTNDNDSVGLSIITTIDAKMQQEIYNLLNNAKDSIIVTGSVTVISNAAEVLACVSSPGYDANLFRKDNETRLKLANSPTVRNKALMKFPFESEHAVISQSNAVYDFGTETTAQIGKSASSIRLAADAYNAGTGDNEMPRMVIAAVDTNDPSKIIAPIELSGDLPNDKVELTRNKSIESGKFTAYTDESFTGGVYTVYGYFENGDSIFSVAVNIVDDKYDHIDSESDAVKLYSDIANIVIKYIG